MKIIFLFIAYPWIFKPVFLEDIRKVDVQYLWSRWIIDNVNFNVEKMK